MDTGLKRMFWGTLGLLVVLAGCSLPDLKPYSDATAELHTAVVQTHSSVRDDLLAIPDPNHTTSDPEHLANKFTAVWQPRMDAMEAMVAYSDSLAAIAAAGKSGSENAGAVADSLNNLLGALSAKTMGVDVVATAKSLYGLVAQVRAASAFADAVKTADPAIQALATRITADFEALKAPLIDTAAKRRSSLTAADPDLQAAIDLYKQEQRMLRKAQDRMAAAVDKVLTADAGSLQAAIQERDAAIKEQQASLQALEGTRQRYEAYQAQVQSITERRDLELELIAKAQKGFAQWAALHGQLADQAKKGFPLNVRALLTTVVEIRDIVQQSKENKANAKNKAKA
jgi:hypothetical protein